MIQRIVTNIREAIENLILNKFSYRDKKIRHANEFLFLCIQERQK